MKFQRYLLLSVILLNVLFITDLCLGSYGISLRDLTDFVQGKGSENVAVVLLEIRLPRVLTALLAGASLAAGGAVMQSVFSNDLVAPEILGVSSGASLGATFGIMLGISTLLVSFMAFAGGLLAVFLTVTIASLVSRNESNTLLIMVLCGIVVSAFFSALVELICTFGSDNSQVMSILFFLFGSFSRVNSGDVLQLMCFTLIPLVLLWFMSYHLDVMSLGEEEARRQGQATGKVRITAVALTTLMCAALISHTGIIGWVGLIVPHAVRFMLGSSHRILIPGSALAGGIALLAVDILCRFWTSYEVPAGIVTSIIGAPVFVLILRGTMRRRRDA